MLRLPNELLELIFLPLPKRDLWALTRVSYRLRRITLFLFLARYNISEEQIRSGVLSVSAEWCFLVIVAAHIHPLRKLEIVRGRFARELPGILPAVLAALPPIPDIVVHNSYEQFMNRVAMAKILAASCQRPTPTLAFVGRGTVSVSTHRPIRPVCWKSIPCAAIRTASPCAPCSSLIAEFLSLALVAFGYLLCGAVNIGEAVSCIYRHVIRVRWDLEDRITTDMGPVHAHWMRIQTLLPETAQQFTLVTFGSANDECLTIPALSALTEDQRSALIATVELPRHLQTLTISEGANSPLADVMNCVRRHPQLRTLDFAQCSVSPVSVVDRNTAGRITTLTAPVAYIPAILQAEPNVHHLSITFPEPKLGHSALNIPSCLDALDAIASLPGTHPICLTLSFTKASITGCELPWHFQAPSRPLQRVIGLTFFTDGAPGAVVDIELLGRWLAACFPTLTRICAPDVEQDPQVEAARWEARKTKAVWAVYETRSP
ncbi:hypothetical protein FB451DRAFT_173877 [Mycena latifolia]|nr:hypothetical protein FB451DRAFT_173877 [Mycena latifolia]